MSHAARLASNKVHIDIMWRRPERTLGEVQDQTWAKNWARALGKGSGRPKTNLKTFFEFPKNKILKTLFDFFKKPFFKNKLKNVFSYFLKTFFKKHFFLHLIVLQKIYIYMCGLLISPPWIFPFRLIY